MEMENERRDKGFFFFRPFCNNLTSSTTMVPPSPGDQIALAPSDSSALKPKPGWKAMPYILGNETVERIATYGALANFNVFLTKKFNMSQVGAANVIFIWNGASNCIPIFGAIVADSYLGKFATIASGSFATLLGIVILILIVWIPQLLPPTCPDQQDCTPPTSLQFGILILGLSWLSIGTGGIRPCTIPFAIDQFDTSSSQGRKGVRRFYNWYYTTQTLVMLFNMTVIVYIQNKDWVSGFGLLALLMSCAIILFFAGTRVYNYTTPQGSLLYEIAQVFVAAYRKRGLKDPACVVEEEAGIFYYDPPLKENRKLKMPLTKHLKCLNKAALVQENDLNSEGLAANPWRLCSIQQVEESKCLMKLIPIWASVIFSLIPMAQQGTFPVAQAERMDRHLGRHFEMPQASIGVVPLITIGIWLPCYDFFIQPALVKLTKREEGITSLEKIVIGNIFSILTMVTAGLVEIRRRAAATTAGGAAIWVMWLVPQLVFLGFSEVFSGIGQIEFYNGEAPEHMKSVGNSLMFLGGAFSNCAGTLVMNVVNKVTGKQGWLDDDPNRGRYDNYYFVIAGLASLNLVYLVACVKRYR